MPVSEQGRFVSTSSTQLTEWLAKESGKPVHIASGETDLTSELKRGVAFARQNRRARHD
jgi:hypothetical protein